MLDGRNRRVEWLDEYNPRQRLILLDRYCIDFADFTYIFIQLSYSSNSGRCELAHGWSCREFAVARRFFSLWISTEEEHSVGEHIFGWRAHSGVYVSQESTFHVGKGPLFPVQAYICSIAETLNRPVWSQTAYQNSKSVRIVPNWPATTLIELNDSYELSSKNKSIELEPIHHVFSLSNCKTGLQIKWSILKNKIK